MLTSESGNNILTAIEADAILSHLAVISYSAKRPQNVNLIAKRIEAGKAYSAQAIDSIVRDIEMQGVWRDAQSDKSVGRAKNAIRVIFGREEKK